MIKVIKVSLALKVCQVLLGLQVLMMSSKATQGFLVPRVPRV